MKMQKEKKSTRTPKQVNHQFIHQIVEVIQFSSK